MTRKVTVIPETYMMTRKNVREVFYLGWDAGHRETVAKTKKILAKEMREMREQAQKYIEQVLDEEGRTSDD